MELASKKFVEIYKNLYLILFTLIVLFGRSLTGIYIFNYRLGELAIGACLVLSVFFLLFAKRSNKFFYFGDSTYIFLKLIFISFFITAFVTESSFTDIYSYKRSSYIWTLSFLFLGMFAFKNLKVDSLFNKILPALLPLTYILSANYFPQFLSDFFIRYSDKFDFLKASDVFLIFVATNIINQKIIKKEFNYVIYLLLSSAIFIPLFLFKSKGAFLPAVLFLLFEVIRLRKTFLTQKVKSLLLIAFCIPLFYLSTYNIGLQMFVNNYTLEEVDLSSQIVSSVSRASAQKNTVELFGSFFLMDGRLYSMEQMANWRLQIWQDVTRDLFYESEYDGNDNINFFRIEGPAKEMKSPLFGFGYSEMFPAMNHSSRRGTDMKNENVHNFAVNILGKGGILQFSLFVGFYLSIISYWYKKNKNYRILVFFTFALMTAFFDVAMESVRFPFIFFGTVAYLFNEN
tara:strand:+ start:4116 stop:5486 length:1371 start_codon:yes stop_codon:yes gene_type:complete